MANVTFGSIEIREYRTIVGDNPGSRGGAPLSLDWKYKLAKDVPKTVEEYEMVRPPPRKLSELKLSSEQREKILLSQGVSRKELTMAANASKKAQIQRAETIQNYKNDMANYELLHKIKHVFSLCRKSKKKINLLEYRFHAAILFEEIMYKLRFNL